jgi:hypothetical protein
MLVNAACPGVREFGRLVGVALHAARLIELGQVLVLGAFEWDAQPERADEIGTVAHVRLT